MCIRDRYDLYDLYDLAHVAGWDTVQSARFWVASVLFSKQILRNTSGRQVRAYDLDRHLSDLSVRCAKELFDTRAILYSYVLHTRSKRTIGRPLARPPHFLCSVSIFCS